MDDFLRVQKEARRDIVLGGISTSVSNAFALPLGSLVKLRNEVVPKDNPLVLRRSSSLLPSGASAALSLVELLTRRGTGLPLLPSATFEGKAIDGELRGRPCVRPIPRTACARVAVEDCEATMEDSGDGNSDGSVVSSAISCSESRCEEGALSESGGVGGRSFSTRKGARRGRTVIEVEVKGVEGCVERARFRQ